MKLKKEDKCVALQENYRCNIHNIICPFKNVENCATYWRLNQNKDIEYRVQDLVKIENR